MPSDELLRTRLLPAQAASARAARVLVRTALQECELDQLCDSAELAVSELVTNALVHAGTGVRVLVRVDERGLRVEVADGSPHQPVARDYTATSGTGRGLHLVADVTDAWGTFLHADGKVVWFEIGASEITGDDYVMAPPAQHLVTTGDGTVDIELLNFPLLMHAAWQEHASALLREFLLLSLGTDEEATFERHAQASDAMNVLHEQIPAPVHREDPEAIMATATEPSVSASRVVISVSATAVAHFEILDAMLVEALQTADAGLMLVPATQPEVAEMRRWVCQQVRDQATGSASPTPWSSEHDVARPAASTGVVEGWEPREISDSSRAVLAADDAGIIVAASGPALTLLGYATEGHLKGSRLLRIIPNRFHQAHIAGITLHMVNGRSPLLGKQVTVPVIKADGTEVPVDLKIETRLLPGGKRIFVAEFIVDEVLERPPAQP